MAIYNNKRVVLSFLFGAITIIIGAIATLSEFGVPFPVFPLFLTNMWVLKSLLLIAGVILFYDSFKIGFGFSRVYYIIAGLILMLLALFPLLLEFDLLRFLPFALDLNIPPLVIETVLIAFGAYLIVNAFKIIKFYRTFPRAEMLARR